VLEDVIDYRKPRLLGEEVVEFPRRPVGSDLRGIK